jgi:RNA polymerase sigma factor (sigma-70 family)
MRVQSDERLARRAARGDRHAFEAIYRRYHQPLYRFCVAMVGNPADAQDALQNTMVKALRALPGERREIRLKPWLYRIARNESIELLRRRRESAELDAGLEAAGGVAETAEARARLRDLLADLEQLPERQRAVLVMRELSGLDFAEIGESLETSAAVARQTLYEARLSLRQLEEGREMPCAGVMRELSDGDGRVSRRREIRAHLRSCPDCRAFRNSIESRRSEIGAIAPLPLAASAGVLHGILGTQVAAGTLAGAGTGAGAAIAGSTIAKSAATVAVATVVGVSAADRGGLVDLPLPGGGAVEAVGTPSPSPVQETETAVGNARNALDAPGDAQPARPAVRPGKAPKRPESTTGATGASTPAEAGPPASSVGAAPPGGGYGSAGKGGGRPEALPQASAHGQQTAAGHKPDRAGGNSARGAGKGSRVKGAAGRGRGKPAATSPKPKPPPPAKPPPPPPHPLVPPSTEKAGPTAPGQAARQALEP